MVEEVGLRVRVTTVGQAGAMNKLADQTATGVQKGTEKGYKNAKLPPPLQKLAGAKNGKAGGASGGALGSAAVAGGVAGLVMAGVQGLGNIMGKMFHTLVESSGSLKSVMKQLNVGFMQIIRPMGDLLASLLRPVAMFFRTVGREINKQFKAWRKANPNASATDTFDALLDIYGKVFTDVLSRIDWNAVFSKILAPDVESGSSGLALWLDQFINPLAYLVGNLGSVLKGAENVWNGLVDFVTAFNTMLTRIWSITSSADLTVSNITKGFETIANWIYDGLVGVYNAIARIANQFGAGLQLLPTTAEMAALKQMAAYNNTTTARATVAGGTHAYAYKDREIQYLDSGGTVLQTGAAVVHKGEVVLNPQQQAAASNLNATLVIPGAALADAIDRRVDYYYRTKVTARRG